MCGVVGAVSKTSVNYLLLHLLKGLQHRGQQTAGLATLDGNYMHIKKDLGLVHEVITEHDMPHFRGNTGVGHVRYPTAGSATDPALAHPFYVNYPFGIILAHNGNLTNATEIYDKYLKPKQRHILTKSDSEVLINLLSVELEDVSKCSNHLDNNKIFAAVTSLNQKIRGGYAVISSIANYGMVAFRDPHGIRPLSLGKQIHDNGYITYILASETCVFDINGFEYIRDIAPGECLIITLDGKLESRICAQNTSLNICIFEFVYLSRPDSIIDGAPVYLARQNMGKRLASTIAKSNIEIDVIVSVPDTARLSAIEVANQLHKPYKEGFVKHTFIGRTFMLATQTQRNTAIRNKLNPIKGEFFGKNVLLVDDSIVRGTTSAQIVSIVRNSGAKKVFFASAAPQIRYSNFYGIDLPTRNELIAYNQTDDEIAATIGADKVIFQTLDDLKMAIHDANPKITNFETSCFDGKYLTNDIVI